MKDENIKNNSPFFPNTFKPLSEKRDQMSNPFRVAYNYFFTNTNRKTYTLLTLTFAFIAVLSIFAIYPTIISITQISKKIEEYKGIRTQQQQKISNISLLQNSAESLISNGGLYEYINFFDNTYYTNNIENEKIFKDVIDLSKDIPISVESIKSLDNKLVESATNTKQASYEISITSKDKESINQFTDKLKTSQHLYAILKYFVTSPNTDTTSPLTESFYKATINFASFYHV